MGSRTKTYAYITKYNFQRGRINWEYKRRGSSLSITAPINIIIINTLTENKENKFIAARIRKIISKIKLLKEVVKVIKISAKFINIIISRRNPNIVYENLIEENFILLKIIIIKIIFNEDKSLYEIAMVSFKIF
jgi:hypothetical protein